MTQQPQQDSSTVVTVSLKKYDNQAGQYKPLLVFEVTPEQIVQVEKQFHRGELTEVATFYEYSYTIGPRCNSLYSVSPALFDHLKL